MKKYWYLIPFIWEKICKWMQNPLNVISILIVINAKKLFLYSVIIFKIPEVNSNGISNNLLILNNDRELTIRLAMTIMLAIVKHISQTL